jgi:hypothetical protein
MFLHNLLNVLVQIANKMGLQKNYFTIHGYNRENLQENIIIIIIVVTGARGSSLVKALSKKPHGSGCETR